MSDDEPDINRPTSSRLHTPADLIRPGQAPEAVELWSCGCCITIDDAIDTELDDEPVGTELVVDGRRYRKTGAQASDSFPSAPAAPTIAEPAPGRETEGAMGAWASGSTAANSPAGRRRARVRRMAERLAAAYLVPGELSYTLRVEQDGSLVGLLDGTPWAATLELSGDDGLSVHRCPPAEVRDKTGRRAFAALERALAGS